METSEGTKLKVRLYGIDAPETEKVNHRTGNISKAGQPYGAEAFKALESKILDKKVKVDIMDHYCPNVNRIKSTVSENRFHDHYSQLL